MEDKLTYFDCVEIIESAFPETTALDYTKMSSEEFEAKIRKLFEDLNLRVRKIRSDYSTPSVDITEEKIAWLVANYRMMCKENLEYKGITSDPTFDQNSAFIKLKLSEFKNEIYQLLKEENQHYGLLDKDLMKFGYGRTAFSNEEQKEQIQDKQEIENYLRNLFTITKRKKESVEYIGSLHLPLAQTICNRFGLDDSFTNEIMEIIQNNLRGAYVYEGNSRMGDFGIEFESVSINNNRLNESIEKCIKLLTESISLYTKVGIENARRLAEERKNNKSNSMNIGNPLDQDPLAELFGKKPTTERTASTPTHTMPSNDTIKPGVKDLFDETPDVAEEEAKTETSDTKVETPEEKSDEEYVAPAGSVIGKWIQYQDVIKQNQVLAERYQTLARQKEDLARQQAEIEKMMADVEQEMKTNMEKLGK